MIHIRDMIYVFMAA